MSTQFKHGVTFKNVRPECVMGIIVATSVYEKLGHTHTVTSICDGAHSPGSLHYKGLAFDSRTWADTVGTQMEPHIKKMLARELQLALGQDWDVVVESTHIHCEFDPK